MLNLFNSIIPSTGITPLVFIILVLVSLVLGGIMALIHTYRNDYTKSFVMTLAILPAVICVVILMVNGNIGAGVAVAGTFSLVRFRSAPGTAREIGAIFAVMGMGLIMGMGYIGYAALFTCLIGLAILMYSRFSADGKKSTRKILKITIPENLNYSDVFDEFLEKYTKSYKLKQVKTSNMGSLYKLSYEIVLTDPSIEKEFIDQLRTRNGNLEISLAEYQIQNTDQL
ncbi:MAG: DUF4956 domain-containing protein [Eubacteriales bacterium]|jgi:hypothetical protein|nr:DUF4956 domain-containing protein [Oscillospiraceae bacterium]MDO4421510.1 DUF4956 domain-containing protein [Eubacteriales bacterium]